MDYSLTYRCFLEFLGTLVMILLGDGVCATTGLKKSKGYGASWITIAFGWGFAVMAGVFIAHNSGAHLNPCVTIGLAAAGAFPWSEVFPYIIAQMAGAFLGAVMVYVVYKEHFDITDDPQGKLTIFCTMPAIEGHNGRAFVVETVCAFVLVLLIICLLPQNYTSDTGKNLATMGGLGAFPVTMVIVSIGMSIGGPTGYAMNPARDLGPRIAHQVLPIKGKRDSGWTYAWVPILGPIFGAVLAAGVGYIWHFCTFF